MTSGDNNFDYFPENQLTAFSASYHRVPKSTEP